MWFRSGRGQLVLTVLVIAAALALLIWLDGWRWSLLIPAAVVAGSSRLAWRRRATEGRRG